MGSTSRFTAKSCSKLGLPPLWRITPARSGRSGRLFFRTAAAECSRNILGERRPFPQNMRFLIDAEAAILDTQSSCHKAFHSNKGRARDAMNSRPVEPAKRSLDDEIDAYEAMRGELEVRHWGKWVLIHDGKLIRTFETFERAAVEAVHRYGRGPYLIRQVGAPPLILPASVAHHATGGHPSGAHWDDGPPH